MKRTRIFIAFILLISVLVSCAPADSKPVESEVGTDAPIPETEAVETEAPVTEARETEAPETEPEEVESLYKFYEDRFYVGVALPDGAFSKWNKIGDLVLENFNSFTCENEMKPDYVLDQTATRKDVEGNYTTPVVKFNAANKLLQRAEKNGVKVRLHTLVWHAQTPAWFFTVDYTNTGALVSRDVMLLRMESYIKQVIEYYDTNYPGLIYAIDVVNEAIDPGNGDKDGVRKVDNKWYDTIGADYIYWAFYFANKYAPDYMHLFYNDYSCMYKVDVMLKNLKPILDEGLMDGIGMQGHLSVSTSMKQFVTAAETFCNAGFELQITELDIGVDGNHKTLFKNQGKAYKQLMKGLVELCDKGCNITSITLWGVNDDMTWRGGEYPLLFNADMTKKPAYYGFMLSDVK